MNRLLTAASDSTRDVKPPNTWQEFQSFCLDAFPLVQEKFNTGRHQAAKYWASSGYGKNGDKQHGVDIFDHFSPTTMQCKLVGKFDETHLMKELEALKGYRAAISAHFIVTSLEETNRAVSDFVARHNAALEHEGPYLHTSPMPPAMRLPKLYVLNWPEIRSIFYTDFLLALKWGFYPHDSRYYNLNGVDLTKLLGAASTMGCSVPPGGGGKSPRVLETINILTQSLDADAIASVGETETLASSTINGLWKFLELIDQTYDMGKRVKPALTACESLDGVSVQRGLQDLNTLVTFQGRFEAFKYLNRLADMVRRLYYKLDDDNFYVFGDMEIEHEGVSVTDTDYSIRHYNFTDIDSNMPPWYIPRKQLSQNSKFIAREIRKVRINIKPPSS